MNASEYVSVKHLLNRALIEAVYDKPKFFSLFHVSKGELYDDHIMNKVMTAYKLYALIYVLYYDTIYALAKPFVFSSLIRYYYPNFVFRKYDNYATMYGLFAWYINTDSGRKHIIRLVKLDIDEDRKEEVREMILSNTKHISKAKIIPIN